MGRRKNTKALAPVTPEAQGITVGAPSKEQLREQKRGWLQAKAAGIFALMNARGRIVLEAGTPIFIPNSDQDLKPFLIERGNADFETFVHRCTARWMRRACR